jgi:hypothetical protein
VKRLEDRNGKQDWWSVYPGFRQRKAAGRRSRRRRQRQAPGRRQVVPLDVQKGDRILFGKYSGSEIKLDGEEYLIMREDEVLGILDAKKAAKKAS